MYAWSNKTLLQVAINPLNPKEISIKCIYFFVQNQKKTSMLGML